MVCFSSLDGHHGDPAQQRDSRLASARCGISNVKSARVVCPAEHLLQQRALDGELQGSGPWIRAPLWRTLDCVSGVLRHPRRELQLVLACPLENLGRVHIYRPPPRAYTHAQPAPHSQSRPLRRRASARPEEQVQPQLAMINACHGVASELPRNEYPLPCRAARGQLHVVPMPCIAIPTSRRLAWDSGVVLLRAVVSLSLPLRETDCPLW